MCNTKQLKNFFVLKKFYDQKQKAHIVLDEHSKAMHDSAKHTQFKFLHNVKHVLNQERDIIIHVILKKNKTRHNKIFLSF